MKASPSIECFIGTQCLNRPPTKTPKETIQRYVIESKIEDARTTK